MATDDYLEVVELRLGELGEQGAGTVSIRYVKPEWIVTANMNGEDVEGRASDLLEAIEDLLGHTKVS